MVAEDKYCNDILIQLLAINKSLKSLNKKILKMELSCNFKYHIMSLRKGDYYGNFKSRKFNQNIW